MNVLIPLFLAGLGWAIYRGTQEGGRGRAADRLGPVTGETIDPVTGLPLCELPASQVAQLTGREVRAWVLCAGRRNIDVQTLANELFRTDPRAAGAVLDLWNARRRIDTAEPSGELPDRMRADVERLADASDEEARGPAFEPTPLPSFGGSPSSASYGEAPTGYDPNLARAMAAGIQSMLRADGRQYSRDRLRSFQRAAGISDVDGLYGCVTRNALVHFGISEPPAPMFGSRDCSSRPYRAPDVSAA